MKESQTARILTLLKSKGRVTNVELNRIAFRYAARICDLRKEGHTIVTNRIKDGLFTFTYRGCREEKITMRQPRTTQKKGQLTLL